MYHPGYDAGYHQSLIILLVWTIILLSVVLIFTLSFVRRSLQIALKLCKKMMSWLLRCSVFHVENITAQSFLHCLIRLDLSYVDTHLIIVQYCICLLHILFFDIHNLVADHRSVQELLLCQSSFTGHLRGITSKLLSSVHWGTFTVATFDGCFQYSIIYIVSFCLTSYATHYFVLDIE